MDRRPHGRHTTKLDRNPFSYVARALKLVRELEEKYAKKEATEFDLALVHAALANDDEAMSWLEKDFAGRNMSGLVYVASTVIHQRLRADPRYQDLLQRMHLKV